MLRCSKLIQSLNKKAKTMNTFFKLILTPASPAFVELALLFMRVTLGIITMLHGFPKIMGGVPMWLQLGTFVNPLGIYFLPLMWGFLGACTEFFGGMLLAFGLSTRIASLALVFMMIVATAWHINRGDGFQVYSYPLTLIFIFFGFFIMGAGPISLDYFLSR